MGPFAQERPCIHVVLAAGVADELFRAVELGAEEEGVPCRLVQETGNTAVDLAYAAAHSSRFNIGVAVAAGEVVLHETHMPPQQPVLAFALAEDRELFCRLMGSNAARLVVRRPLRFADDPVPFSRETETGTVGTETITAGVRPAAEKAASEQAAAVDAQQIARLVALVMRKLEERGIA